MRWSGRGMLRCTAARRAAFACCPTRRSRWSTRRTGQIDPTQPLAANRIIPIESAPEYSEGRLWPVVNVLQRQNSTFPTRRSMAGDFTRSPINVDGVGNVLDGEGGCGRHDTSSLNEPTSWYWNIRVGDKLQINGVGPVVHGGRADGRDAPAGQLRAVRERGAGGNPSPLRVLQPG